MIEELPTPAELRQTCGYLLRVQYKEEVGYASKDPEVIDECGDMRWIFATWKPPNQRKLGDDVYHAYRCDYDVSRNADMRRNAARLAKIPDAAFR